MATKRRIQYPGARHHVTVHSLDELWPFADDASRELVLVDAADAFTKHGIECHCYVVMSNHVHFCVRTPDGGGLSLAMQQLNSNVARRYNRTHGRRGRVLLAPYDAVEIERPEHLLEVVRYDVLNPVRAGMCADPAEYRWSSYRATAGLARRPGFLTTSWILDLLGGAARYRAFVAEGAPTATLAGILLAG